MRLGAVAAGALAAAVVLTGCSAGTTSGTGYGKADRKPGLYGSYLAGRYANTKRDSDAAAGFFGQALTLDPGNAQLLERALVSEVAKGDIGEAAKRAEQLLAAKAESRLSHMVLAVKKFREGQFAAAREHFQKLDGKALAELGNKLGTAWTYVAEGQPAEAQKLAASLLGNDDIAAFAHMHKGLIEEGAGQDAAAGRSYAAAYKASNGESLRVVQLYGIFLQRTGQTPKARAVYTAFLDKSPNHPLIRASLAALEKGSAPERLVTAPAHGLGEVFFSLANSLGQERSIDLSVFYVQLALALNPKSELAITLLADRLQSAKRCEEAIEVYGRIERGSPYYHNARLQSAECLVELKQLDKALTAFQAALDGSANDVETYAAMGNALREAERYPEAEAQLSRAIAALAKPEERHWVIFFARGIARERQKQWDGAEDDLKKALVLKPEQPSVMNYLAYTWIEHGINQDQALRMLHKAVELKGDDGYIIDSLGWAYYKRGDYRKAVLYLEQAILLEPAEATINDHLGDAYWKVGRIREARFQWDHALKLDPDDKERARIERKLRDGLDVVEASESSAANPVKPTASTTKP